VEAMNALSGTYTMRVNFSANCHIVFSFLDTYDVFVSVLGVRATINH
jgi:hypothetical protein